MGPRPFGRGNYGDETRHEIWGLASMGPRPFGRGNLLSSIESLCAWLASMGPRPFGRGNADCRGHPPHDVLLQWGRDLSAAETRMIHDVSLGTLRFNGAATFQPRKPALLVSILLPQNGASMGTRPFSRGNLDILTALMVRQRKHQRGRDLLAAET